MLCHGGSGFCYTLPKNINFCSAIYFRQNYLLSGSSGFCSVILSLSGLLWVYHMQGYFKGRRFLHTICGSLSLFLFPSSKVFLLLSRILHSALFQARKMGIFYGDFSYHVPYKLCLSHAGFFFSSWLPCRIWQVLFTL